MPRPEKVEAVESIKNRLEAARAVFLTEYAGLSVKQQQDLRRGLRSGGAEYQVVKMTLARRAAAELEMEAIDELLVGPTALAYANDDPVSAAKALKDFSKDNDQLVIKGGMLRGVFLPPEKIAELADIEPREVLLAKIAGAAKAPLSNMAGLMAAFTRNAATVFAALVDKKQEAAPQAEEPEPQATTDEVAAPPAEAVADDAVAEDDGAEAPTEPEAAVETEIEAAATDESSEDSVEAAADETEAPAAEAETPTNDDEPPAADAAADTSSDAAGEEE
ncbi:MAG: 50S ribosomal protein L10 [Acidimicrobiia bacterium]|nr:50S ribosomal protein L10 [Acidimicrobiia bacterium]